MKKKIDILEILAGEVNNYNESFEDIVNVYYSVSDLVENTSWDKSEVARAVYFGDIQNWNDDIFYIDVYGNISSCSIEEHERNILSQEQEIIDKFLDIYGDSLEDYHLEWLKELGVESPEGIESE